jgi:hypothetical protein
MVDKTTLKDQLAKIPGYFSPQDLCIILVMAVLAFLTSSFGLSHVLPGGSPPGLVHAFLKLPGPGAGIFISSAFICLWLVLGLLLIKKPGTALAMAVLIFLFMVGLSLVMGRQVYVDYLVVMVAIIIEISGLLALEKKPWSYIFPVLLALMGLITLALMAAGEAKMGENGAAATVFPLGYAATGIIALCLAVICFMYPMKYVAGAGISQMFYITYCWLFNGTKGFATWVPTAPAIPALLAFALVCGSLMAAVAYGIYLIWQSYNNHSPGKVKIA